MRRFPQVAEQVRGEKRSGIPWFESTHVRTPLQNVVVTKGRGAARMLDVLDGLSKALAVDAFPGADWCPPGDDEHADLLHQPLDPETSWVRCAIFRELGHSCAACARPCDTILPDGGGGFAVVHPGCVVKSSDPDERKRRAAEYLRRQRQTEALVGGFPPQRDQEIHGE